jgi:hypothetical protein
MERPMTVPAPVVTAHAAGFRDLWDHQYEVRHFQQDLTGLIVWPNQILAHTTRCFLDSTDKTNVSRILADALWLEDAVNRRRLRFLLQQTKPHRHRLREALVVRDDTLGDYGDRRDHSCDVT